MRDPQREGRMVSKTAFFVQQFILKSGRLTLGQRDIALTDEAAKIRASMVSLRVQGAAALRIVPDDKTGEIIEVVVLASYGEVPANFADQFKSG